MNELWNVPCKGQTPRGVSHHWMGWLLDGLTRLFGQGIWIQSDRMSEAVEAGTMTRTQIGCRAKINSPSTPQDVTARKHSFSPCLSIW